MSENPARPSAQQGQVIEDSALCEQCSALKLDQLVRLPLEGENLPETIWNRKRPYTWRTPWTEGPRNLANGNCSLCRIIRAFDVGCKIGAHSARTFFKSQSIEDTTIFELYYHTTMLLVPKLQQDTPPSTIGSRVINPVSVDYGLIRRWLFDCFLDHGTACLGTSSTLIGLKVIDCKTRNIISAPEACKYIALSYLWGQTTPMVNPEQETSCNALEGHVPQVVEDAIKVSFELGIQYLWVDKYCIDQADAAEKHQFIRQMDKIYNDATLTIVAAAGEDAEHGLPGVSGAPRESQSSIDIGGRRFLGFRDSTEEVRRSKWSSRGWTYQEGLLPRRRLVFTQSQAYFQCMESHCWEGLALPHAAVEPPRFLQVFPDKGIGSDAGDIVSRLNEYASKELTYDADILNAFLGILHPYQERGVLHYWGLPFMAKYEERMEEDFMLALGWNTRLPEVASRREEFPSWSWVGWSKLDNLRVPWGPSNMNGIAGLFKVNQELGFAVRVAGPRGIISLPEYARAMMVGGCDFSDFSKHIIVSGPSSECTIKSAWDIEADLPPQFRRKGAMSVVRMMGVPEVEYNTMYNSPLNIMYLGCYSSSGLFFSFLIVQKRLGSDDYIRVGTLNVVTSWMEPEGELLTASGRASMRSIDYMFGQEWQGRVKEFFQKKWELKEFKIS